MRCIFFIQQLFLSSQRIHHRALSVTAYDKFLHLSDGMHFSTQQITTSNLELYHILDYWKTLPSMSTGSPSSKYKPIGEHRHCCVTFKATVPMLIFRAWATCGMSQLIHKCRKNHVINSSRHLFPDWGTTCKKVHFTYLFFYQTTQSLAAVVLLQVKISLLNEQASKKLTCLVTATKILKQSIVKCQPLRNHPSPG